MRNSRFKIGIISFIIVLLASIPFITQEDELFVVASNDVTAEIQQDLSLEDKIEQILQDQTLDRSIVGVSIRNAETGEEVYANDGDLRLHPASNMKLLTAAAALEILGPDYQFTTEVLTDGNPKKKVLQGNLYLKGKGDPTLLKEDFDRIAEELKSKGIMKVHGNLIADDSWYDDVRLSEDLNWSDEPFYTGAQVSALTLSPNEDYDTGTVIVEVTAGDKAGDKSKVNVEPHTNTVEIVNETETVAAGEQKSISIEREHGTNRIIIEGKMPLDGSMSRSWVSVWEPTYYAADVFKQALAEQGIDFIGQSKVERGVTPDDAAVLVTHTSMPLSEILIPFMKLSNNGHGEMLTKEMGQVVHGEGSWDKGLEVVKDVAVSFGVDAQSILLRDGSGMSHKTYIPASELSGFLFEIQDEPWYGDFEYSLPVAGESERFVGGTLRNRMTSEPTKGNVFAKTGSLTSVSTLSGYVNTVDGETMIFSILNNNFISGSMQPIQDTIVTEIAKHSFEE
jgi:D-alanyl-D-alanine carboxypeptidase/D-alanyl-D-alanine-endopeptidase (penicillin-binding protein 4)